MGESDWRLSDSQPPLSDPRGLVPCGESDSQLTDAGVALKPLASRFRGQSPSPMGKPKGVVIHEAWSLAINLVHPRGEWTRGVVIHGLALALPATPNIHKPKGVVIHEAWSLAVNLVHPRGESLGPGSSRAGYCSPTRRVVQHTKPKGVVIHEAWSLAVNLVHPRGELGGVPGRELRTA